MNQFVWPRQMMFGQQPGCGTRDPAITYVTAMGAKSFSRLIAILLLGFLALSAIAGVFMAEATLHPGRNALSPGNKLAASEMARHSNSVLTEVAIAAAQDGVTLRAWSIRPHDGNGDAVILLHGLTDNRFGMTGYAELLLGRGFSVLLPDARAHGASGGDLATFGLLETEDIHRWLDWLQQNDHPGCIFGLGESMGAAQLLQSLRSETRFCAVAAESPFASFREIGYDRLGQFFRTGPWLGRTVLHPIIEFAFFWARWKYKLDFEQASPQDAVASTEVPVFLIHGQSDSNIPVRHSRLIAARNQIVVLWEGAGTDHCGAVSTHPAEFDEKLTRWFDSHATIENRLAVELAH
jgi:pimeloyl-ACP methyl ester carboxylesterase